MDVVTCSLPVRVNGDAISIVSAVEYFEISPPDRYDRQEAHVCGPSGVLDILLEIFAWVGFVGFVALAAVAVGMWAADGTWLPADAIVDREGERTVVRWYDDDGDANSAVAEPGDAAALAGRDAASIWYRHGWTGRMRLTRRPPGLRRVIWSAAGMLALGVVSVAASVVLYFSRG